MELQAMGKGAALPVSEAVFARDYNKDLVSQVVTAHMAAGRAGTKAQKTRSEVSGGGIKPWRQKGTGRARAGTTRSPIWRKGGATFAAKPRSFAQKVNRKMYRGAMKSILSELVRQDRLHVATIAVAEPKTKVLVAQLAEWKLSGRIMIVVDELDANLLLAARNIPYMMVVTHSEINPVDLVAADHVLISEAAVKKIEEKLG